MHIVHVGKYYAPYRGGIETVVELLCRGLARRGARVTALVSNDARDERRETIDGVEVIRLGCRAMLDSQPLNPRLRSTLRSLDADIVHFHTPNPLGALAVLSASPRVPLVVTHHSDIVRQKVLGVAATAAHALLYAAARRIVAPTPRHVRYSTVLQPFRRKVEVIHLPIQPEPFATADARWDAALPDAWRSQPLVLFVGRLVYYKGVDVLLRALAATPGLNLAVVGIGPLKPELQRLSEQLGIQDRLRFLGAIDDERLRALYKCARVLVLPSVAPSEAFGMVQLEAMAAGCPVISTDLKSGVPYVNLHGRTGLVVPPSDAAAMATALARLRDDQLLAKHLGRAGLERVKREFDLETVVTRHLELYATLLS